MLEDEGLEVVGQVVHPDPYTAIMNALQFYMVDEIVISTFAGERSGWLRNNLIERVRASRGRRSSTSRPPSPRCPRRGAADGERQRSRARPPRAAAANQSSRVDAQMLGMLLFIISEVMLFGAFFTAYFFIRVVNNEPWPGDGNELPVAVAGVNTAILLSSSFTMHWALEGQARQPPRDAHRPAHHAPARHLPRDPDQRVRGRSASRRRERASSIFYGSPACTAPTSSSASRLLFFATTRAFRGHFTEKEHRGVEIPGIYWHFVDVMWIVVYTTIYLI